MAIKKVRHVVVDAVDFTDSVKFELVEIMNNNPSVKITFGVGFNAPFVEIKLSDLRDVIDNL